ncbi:chemotaxis response regulator protein-glutamate methylesterase [Maridesulfovibrio ferrireducens]|uniref:chemotaxis response regulator protein-glutamate methylesterase n=1 Tax=Maridesulfovibrio ferrireducens TaxID=246191 RepID=UPI001A34F91E|nr:chemotaxis response regulator protein-glutamate methylesterase [Maridesulfovibrio ferrireducens]MBI9112978.1 chemotaxis response regulator protein-glutamate methylesterase [Maridesulfovibrio ferrireducens]
MRIGIVNDMAMAVEVLKRIVNGAGFQVAWVAFNGEEAVFKCCRDVPDIVLMDLIMPVMDGAEATRRIMKECPCSILVVTASIESNASKVFEAMGAGALDVVTTPEMGIGGELEGAKNLTAKISLIRRLQGVEVEKEVKPITVASLKRTPRLLAIGSSTGGPTALATVLGALPADFPAAIVIIQHVDGSFSENLANWLNGQTKLEVSLAKRGDILHAGKVLLAPGNRNMLLGTGGIVHLTDGPGESLYVPSVDIFFKSLCCAGIPEGSAAVLLTGMGADGAKGLLELREKGWMTIAQDKESSVVWGMPGAAVKLGAARKVSSIESMAQVLIRHFK